MLSKRTGASGENFATKLLIKNGYKIITRNFKCKIGEIDIVAQKEDTLIFVEVKTRRSTKFGVPQEAVTSYKLRKIARVGDFFCLLNKNLPVKRRIDVVSILVLDGKVEYAKIIQVV